MQKPGQHIWQLECRHPEHHKQWREDDSCGNWSDEAGAIEDALRQCNLNPGWQYRVVRFDRNNSEIIMK